MAPKADGDTDIGPFLGSLPTLFGETSPVNDDDERVPGTGFLDLPPELRNEIYALAAVDDLITLQCKKCHVMKRQSNPQQAEHRFQGCKVSSEKLVAGAWMWVNRNSELSTVDKNLGHQELVRHKYMDHRHKREEWTARNRPGFDTLEKPSITMVSRQVREETLSIYYGNHNLFFTLFNPDIDEPSITKYLSAIGKMAASKIKLLVIVVASKAYGKYIMKNLRPAMRQLGVRPGVVKVKRLRYPRCNCEDCIMKMLRAGDGRDLIEDFRVQKHPGQKPLFQPWFKSKAAAQKKQGRK